MNLDQFRLECGGGTPQEVLAAVRCVRPQCKSVNEAQEWVKRIVQQLLDQDRYIAAACLLWGEKIFDARPRSVRKILETVQRHAQVIVMGAGSSSKTYTIIAWTLLDWIRDPRYTDFKIVSTTAGHSKCLGAETPIRMSDGSVRLAHTIKVGDKIMGPYGAERKVKAIYAGTCELYRVSPAWSDSFLCTADHRLSLKQSYDNPGRWLYKGEIRDVPLRKYLDSTPNFKRQFKAWKTGYDLPAADLEFEPYIIGVWIGDGNYDRTAITNMDQEVIKTWCGYFESKGYRITKYLKKDNKAASYYAAFSSRDVGGRGRKANPFLNYLRAHCQDGQKRLPQEMLRGSYEQRMKLLAGILDSDGTLNCKGFLLVGKPPRLKADIKDLVISLGLSVSEMPDQMTDGVVYWRIGIYGECFKIPTLLKRCERSRVDRTNESFTVSEYGQGDWVGIETDGDHRFLLGNGLVTHNSGIFSTLHGLHEQALIKLPGIRQDGFIGLDRQNRHGAIIQVAIPAGDTGRGVLQGAHPLPRPTPHPKFGSMSRVRIVMDEAIEIPIGVWVGVDNLLGSKYGPDTVKAIAACNPTKVESILATKAEPATGWIRVEIDSDKEWVSRAGWNILRIDAADSENVKQKRLIYPGFMTIEGFDNYRLQQGGENNYLIFGRGMFPLKGSVNTMVPPILLDNAKGTLIFQGQGKVVACAGVDLAFEGDDCCVMTAGRYGRAIGWRPDGGTAIMFTEPRYCLQIDQLYELPKLLSHSQYRQIRQYCEELGVNPAWLALDRTGNGTGVHDLCKEMWSKQVMGLAWGSGASETKILEEDSDKAFEVYDGLHTEFYGALRKWLEWDYIKIAPHVNTTKLYQEITMRRFTMSTKGKTGKPRIRLEPKPEFKTRLGWSPDHADSLVMVLHVARLNGPERAAMMLERHKVAATGDNSNLGIVDRIKFHDFSQDD